MTAPLRVSIGDRVSSHVERASRHRTADQCDAEADELLEPPVSDLELVLARAWRRAAAEKRAQGGGR